MKTTEKLALNVILQNPDREMRRILKASFSVFFMETQVNFDEKSFFHAFSQRESRKWGPSQ